MIYRPYLLIMYNVMCLVDKQSAIYFAYGIKATNFAYTIVFFIILFFLFRSFVTPCVRILNDSINAVDSMINHMF